MVEILEVISTEHAIINKYLGLMLNAERVDYIKVINFCRDIIENNHHFKEESAIFNTIIDKPALCAGGPYCTLYYDDHMQHAPFKQVANLKKKLNLVHNESISSHLEHLYTKKTPLNIPIEDHQAGKQLLDLAVKLIKIDASRIADLKTIFETYMRIQNYHFEREEKCFLKMVYSLTTINEKKYILEKLKSQDTPLINEIYIEKYTHEKSKVELL